VIFCYAVYIHLRLDLCTFRSLSCINDGLFCIITPLPISIQHHFQIPIPSPHSPTIPQAKDSVPVYVPPEEGLLSGSTVRTTNSTLSLPLSDAGLKVAILSPAAITVLLCLTIMLMLVAPSTALFVSNKSLESAKSQYNDLSEGKSDQESTVKVTDV
ncbi:MAG: hypothetical protein PHN24_11115, partial [Eubacteriales bacterium]|nr:hypothetical protein [Eubacteriales bacterium]